MAMHYSHQLSSGRLAQIVGTFVLIPLFILAVAGFWMSKSEHLFDSTYDVRASLSKSYGLEPGSPVVVSGIPIGRVKQVDLNDRGTVDVQLQLLTRYQEMVKDNSELRITKSGVVMGQTQVDIGMGTSGSPILADGATMRVVEPRDIGDLINEIEPVLMAVKQTLLRVETITQDLQGGLKARSKAFGRALQATQDLPGSGGFSAAHGCVDEADSADSPPMTGSIQRTLGVVDRVTADVQRTTNKLPAILDSAHSTLTSVKRLSDSVGEVSQEMLPVIQTAHTTLSDVSILVRGAKQTFPFNRFAQNAGPTPKSQAAPSSSGSQSLRGDQLVR